MANIKYLPVEKIETEGLQIRTKVDSDAVVEYADAMAAGKKFPPLLTVFDGRAYYLADGFHRLQAAQRLRVAKIACEVRDGSRADARLAACGANQEHGLRRTNEDKRRAVRVVLELQPEWSNRMVAEHVGVSHPFVAEVRQVVTVTSSSVRNPRQLEDFGPPPTTPRRIGADGKSYPVVGQHPPVPVRPAEPVPVSVDAGEAAAPADGAPDAGPGPAPVDQSSGEAAGAAVEVSVSAAPSADAKVMADRTADEPDAAVEAPGADDPAGLVDSLGRPVPPDLAPLWHRRQEVQDALTAISRVRSTLRHAQESQDPLWAEVNFSSTLVQLDQAYFGIDVTKPYVVCPMCQGIRCRACKERGLMGKYRYDTVVPRELKYRT
jgi:uncharacterized ParB-like nuclease family protein